MIVQSSDLQNINKFRSLNDQLTESTTLISESQQQKEALEDAMNELELADEDEKIYFLIGSIYCKISIEQARQEMSNQVEQLVKSMEETSKSISSLTSQMTALKGILYSKFGDSINLERDE